MPDALPSRYAIPGLMDAAPPVKLRSPVAVAADGSLRLSLEFFGAAQGVVRSRLARRDFETGCVEWLWEDLLGRYVVGEKAGRCLEVPAGVLPLDAGMFELVVRLGGDERRFVFSGVVPEV